MSRRKAASPNPALPLLESGASLTGLAIDNLRALRMDEPVPLRRLLLLVGRNGIGKSTFARFFPLLRQSVRGRTREPLLWWERDQVDFGSFGDALRRGSDVMTFTFQFADSDKNAWEVKTSLRTGADGARVSCVEVTEGADSLRLEFSSDGRLTKLEARDGKESFSLSDLAGFESVEDAFTAEPSNRFAISPRAFSRVGRALGETAQSRGVLRDTSSTWLLLESADLQFHIRYRKSPSSEPGAYYALRWGDASWLARRTHFRAGSRSPEPTTRLPIEVERLAFVWRALERLILSDENVNELAANTAYLGPFRAVPERSYRHQAVDIEQLDPRGGNLALFLGALTPDERADLNAFLVDALGFQVHLDKTAGLYAVNIELGGERFNLLDVGFGYSQVLPVAVQLWAAGKVLSSSRAKQPISTLVIEQPELHLHPHQQVLIGQALAASAQADKGPLLVIETHSDHLVSEIGLAVAEGRLSPARVSVLCVEPHPDGGARVRTATYDSDGVLQNWPDGFLSP